MDDCLSDTELAELVAGKLGEADRERARAHLAACATCAELLAAVSDDGGGPSPATPPPPAVGRYVLGELLGEGAFATVHRAHDPSLGREVAVKVLHARRPAAAGEDHLLGEAHTLARLAHPNVVAIHDVGTQDGHIFLAMDLGVASLKSWLREAPREPAAILRLLRQAGEGLAAAHASGLVHRDVKPDNILLTRDGRAMMTDFGLARAERAGRAISADAPIDVVNVTAAGYLVGTPSYMAPEQLRGELADERSDQYGFCVTAFEALAGRRPYRARSLAELREATRAELVDRAALRRLPRWLARILLRGLRADPGRRWPSLRQLLDALAAGPPLARPAVRLGIVAAAAGVLVLASLVWGIVASSRQRARAERRFADVRHLASSFLFEFDAAIEDLPGAMAARRLVVQRAQEYLDGLADEARGDLELARELATAYDRLADIQGGGNANLGDTAGARRSLTRAIALREGLVRATGGDADQAGLAGSLMDRALLDAMDPASVLAGRRALALREALAARDPKDEQRQRGLARAHFTLAELAGERGEYADAVAHDRAAADIYDRVAAAHPERDGDQRNAAIGAKYLGAALQKTGDLAGATRLYRRATGIDGLRVAARPLDHEAKLDLSYSVASLANALREAGANGESLFAYRQALALRQAVAAADPANQAAQAAVARAQRAIGLVLGDLGDLPGKQGALAAAEAIYEVLVAGHPADVTLAARLAETWLELGETELSRRRLDAARPWLDRAWASLAALRGHGLTSQDIELYVRAAAAVATCANLRVLASR